MATPDPRPDFAVADDDEDVDLSDLRWDDSIVLVVFWVLAFVVFLQFFTRYVLNSSLGWTEEIARYLLIGVAFIGCVMATRKDSHIAVEVFYRWMPRPMRKVLQYTVDAVCSVFYAYMAWITVKLAQRTNGFMVSIDIPKALVYWIVAVCFMAMTVYALLTLKRHVTTGTSRLIDPDKPAETAPSME